MLECVSAGPTGECDDPAPADPPPKAITPEEVRAVPAERSHDGYTDIFRKSLIPITEMEKLTSKKEFNRILGALVERPQGRPTLVSNTDKRPALTNTGAGDDFTEFKVD